MSDTERIKELERQVETLTERARVAEQRAKDENARLIAIDGFIAKGDFASATSLIMREQELSRLTAEMDEWKKKAHEMLGAANVRGEEMRVGMNREEILHEEIQRLRSELSTLRRSSVRVDVLLRWIAKPKTGLGWWGTPGRLVDILTRRSTTNTKGE